ncbi:50S ribosomal protein L18P [mine drainage metagenome]|uniref:50S ribosomal protein L18 n=2 Tax=mine drainage metagenome TaxID=410659 RepID=T0YQD7_9ZZZZ
MRTPLIYKRRKEGVTDYRRRFRLVKSGMPRLVVRVSKKGIVVQVVEFNPLGDHVAVSLNSQSLAKAEVELQGNSTPASYLLGYLAGIKAKKLGIGDTILDIGRSRLTVGGRIGAVTKGFIDSGCVLPHDESIFPSDDRVNGNHLKKKLGKKAMDSMKKKLEGSA